MKILRANTAGFCMGVALALKKLNSALVKWEDSEEKNTSRIVTLGPIIHNPQVLEQYAQRGVFCLNDIHDINQNDCVLIRAHGVPKSIELGLRDAGIKVIDATCPKVKKAQLAIEKTTQKNDATLLLFGEKDHPEVKGLVSYATNKSIIFNSLEELYTYKLYTHENYVLASQTTQEWEMFENIRHNLQKKLGKITVLSTICDATHKRQEEIVQIANKVEAVIVVGGKKSGNTRRLADVATAKGVRTWHIETVQELKKEDFANIKNIGLTAGASTPKELIDAVEVFFN